MPVLSIIGIVVVVLTLLICITGCSHKFGNSSGNQITASSIRSISQSEIEMMLKRIETTKEPVAKMGAMCYSMAAPPDRAEYVCPVCGEKTLYTSAQAEFVAWYLPACRREFATIKKSTKLLLSLDESSYCKHCKPDAKKNELKLSVTYDDGKVYTISPVTEYDLRILMDFFKGKLSYETFNAGSRPLKESIHRLRELLGLELLHKERNPK